MPVSRYESLPPHNNKKAAWHSYSSCHSTLFFNKKPVYKKLYLRFQQAKKHVLYILNAKKLMVIKLWC